MVIFPVLKEQYRYRQHLKTMVIAICSIIIKVNVEMIRLWIVWIGYTKPDHHVSKITNFLNFALYFSRKINFWQCVTFLAENQNKCFNEIEHKLIFRAKIQRIYIKKLSYACFIFSANYFLLVSFSQEYFLE